MELHELLSRPDLMEAIGELYVMGFIPESKMNALELECRIDAMLKASPTTYRKDIYWQLSQKEDIPLSDNRIKNIDYAWRQPVGQSLICCRMARLKTLGINIGRTN